ncbi:VgrG protein [Lunatimonas lonarensis]|uniref:VgrG protein n=1 Tax=Lunatimonas lonarensis TaxID=1232681 RepID=R7ZVP8_9BACT|nr:type VI secretion system tip protein VgrG [Lunatimonas lonarensis]EON78220.1 VgrG protein [Lunatimonas lonarensis]
MSNGRSLAAEQSMDLVSHTIKVGGAELPAAVQVASIAIQKELNRIPYAKITVLDGDPASADFSLSNESIFLPGQEIEIALGYHASTETVFKGIITSQRIRIREGGSQLLVECRDKATKMTLRKRSGYYYDSKDSEVIESLITRNRLASEVSDTGYAHAELVQFDCTDWDFMVARAQANGMLCAVDGGKITISGPDLTQESLGTASFGNNILEFDADLDGRNQFSGINAIGWSLADQKVTIQEGSDPNLALNGNLSAADIADAMGIGTLELRHGGKLSEAQLQEWADAKWLFQQLAKIRGRVRIQGVSHVNPGSMIALEGVGDRFSGKVFVSGVSHRYAEGSWILDIQFGINPEWFTDTYAIHSAPAAGLYASVKGLQTGLVTQLGDDPEGEDRILVRIPIVNEEEQGIWCRLTCLDAGKDRGAFFRPEIGDEVIVGFINEDPNQGIVLGMVHSSANPTPVPASDDNHEKGYVSRDGLRLIFDDDKKSILLETPGGKRIHVNEDEGIATMEDEHGNKVVLSESGISVESEKDISVKSAGDIVLEGNNVTVKAQQQATMEGGAGAEVSTSGTAVLKGSLVQIN